MVSEDQYEDIDKWILSRYNSLVKAVLAAYNEYQFHIVYHEILNFCTVDLSKVYIDVTKDRVYTEKKDSVARRAAQSAMYIVLDGLTRMIAPILAFTSDEIWQCMPHKDSDNKTHILLNDMPTYNENDPFAELAAKYEAFFPMRDDVLKALENARNEKTIGKSLEAKVTIYTENEQAYELLSGFGDDLKTLLIVSEAQVVKGSAPENAFVGTAGVAVVACEADGCKCDRCWMHSVKGLTTEDGFLCDRCRNILEL